LQVCCQFRDPPKPDAASALGTLAGLGVTVKVATGDNPLVAEKVCADLGLTSGGTLLGMDIEALDDEALATAATRVDLRTSQPGAEGAHRAAAAPPRPLRRLPR
jgi:magnesium-transporting ATPase (P-type)